MTGPQVPEQGQPMIDPLYCMGETKEDFFRALNFARAGLIQLRQRYEALQEQHETLGVAFDARGKDLEKARATIALPDAHQCRESLRCVACARIHLRDAEMHELGEGRAVVNGTPPPYEEAG